MNRPAAYLGIILMLVCLLQTVATAQQTIEQQLRQQRAAGLNPSTQPTTRSSPMRDQFIAIERIVRSAEPERSTRVAGAYREFATQYLGMFQMSLSSTLPPASLFARDERVPGQQINTGQRMETYNGQLEAMVGAMSPEEVADAILAAHNLSVLAMASNVRLTALLGEHLPEVRPAIAADLQSKDQASIRRAIGAINTLKLTEFDDEILSQYLAGAAGWEQTRVYLMQSENQLVRDRVLKDAQEHPEMLQRHAAIIGQAIRGKAPPRFLLDALDSPSADVRLGAAMALESSGDPSLAEPMAKLLGDSDPRVRHEAMMVTASFSKEAFLKVRPALRQLLMSESQEMRLESAVALAAHQDPAAGPVLLAYLRQSQWNASSLLNNRVLNATTTLTGVRLGFGPAARGPAAPQNTQAIAKLEQWVADHPVTEE